MKLTYFDFPGRAEAIRDALRIGGIAFTDARVSHAEFRALRDAGALPFDSLPNAASRNESPARRALMANA